MTQKIIAVYTDDITGAEGDDVKTRTFTVDGTDYDIDLGDQTWKDFTEAIRPFREAGRVVRRVTQPQPRDRNRSVSIRKWAMERYPDTVKERGRIPGRIVAEYDRVH